MIPRLLAAIAVLVAAAGVTAGAGLVPASGPPSPARHRMPVALGTPDLSCPGPETLLVPPGGRPEKARGPVQVAVMAADTGGTVDAGRLRVRPLTPAGAGATATAPADGDLAHGLDVRLRRRGIVGGLLTASAAGGALVSAETSGSTSGPPLTAGLQGTLARTGDLRGLAATDCGPGARDTWLVGGATATGHRLRLVLTNPAPTTAVADVAVHGPDGRVDTPSGQGVVVAARSAVPLFVDALAPGLPRVAVHVTARSGLVRATLHEAVLRGLVPGGTDDVPAAAAPARRLLLPGLAVVPGPREGRNGDAGVTTVRIAVPGNEEAVASVRLLGPDGEVPMDRAAVANVEGGGVADLLVTGVPSGLYTAVITSDVPVVAGAVIGRGRAPGPAELAWTAAVAPLGQRLVALLPGTARYLSLAATEADGEVWLREVFPDGRLGPHRELDVAAGEAPGAWLGSDAVGLLVEDVTGGPITGALVQTVEDPRGQLVTVLPLAPGPAASAPAPIAVEDRRLGVGRSSQSSSRP